jgi:hypothetical protein
MREGYANGAGGRFSALWVATIASGCAVALAACGGSGSTGYHNPKYPFGAPNVPASLSKCMRANGVSGFPDPRSGPNGGGVGFPGGLMMSSDRIVVFGQSFFGPALVHAEQSCKEYLPPGGPPPGVSESRRVSALAAAACMRRHGLSTFPDPTFRNGNQSLNLPPGLNPDSPAFERAARACGLLNR